MEKKKFKPLEKYLNRKEVTKQLNCSIPIKYLSNKFKLEKKQNYNVT